MPAQSFCAPTRAKSMADMRDIPGVACCWPVTGERELEGITRTPEVFQASRGVEEAWE